MEETFDSAMEEKEQRPRRRVCGIPLWAFILLVILVLVIITAAIVVPLHLVSESKKSSTASSLEQCPSTLRCLNGGTSILTDTGSCACECPEGFTGATCNAPDDGTDISCRTIPLGTSTASVGSAIPRLLEKAQKNYQIQLDPLKLIDAFNAAKLSCTVQNSLVTFNGQSSSPSSTTVTRRQLLIDESQGPAPSPQPSSASTARRPEAPDEDVVDFARVGVLWVAQAESVQAANQAQQLLDARFRSGLDSGDVTSGRWTFQLSRRRILGASSSGSAPPTATAPRPTASSS